MRALAIPWPVEELERRYRTAKSALAAKRSQALWLRKKGLSAAATAEAVGITTETLRQWIKRAATEGLDAWRRARPARGPSRS
ncbi:MAG TPA: helix-turn-helix domain-containing protein [Thermomicrobiales bacterium]|nr:helix-turn-helix domain-containing protein [Thermomicrobiales bacterium]